MLESARILAIAAAVLLAVAVAAWLKMYRGPALQRLDGSAESESKMKVASQLLGLALGASAVAAVLGTLDLVAR